MDHPITLDVGDPVQMMLLGSALGATFFAGELATRGARRPARRNGLRARRRGPRYAVAWVVRHPGGPERMFDSFSQAASCAAAVAVMHDEPIELDVLMRSPRNEIVMLRVTSPGRTL